MTLMTFQPAPRKIASSSACVCPASKSRTIPRALLYGTLAVITLYIVANLAFAYIIIAVYKFYLTQLLEMRWRA